jgi:glycosyltransferase involved in cell wall biosynthesis
MRVLIISHSSGMLGAERSLLEIATDAIADGMEVVVSLPRLGPLKDRLELVGCTCVIVPTYAWLGPKHWVPPVGLLRLFQIRRSVPEFVSLIRQYRPDLVVTNTSVTPAAATAAAALSVPHVWIVRESVARNKQLRSFRRKRAIVSEIFDNSFAVCSVSSFVDEQIASLSHENRQVRRVQPRPSPDPSAQAGNSVPTSSDFRIILPGYFSAEKGQHRAVLAMRFARRCGGQSSRLTLVGQGGAAYTAVLRFLVHALGLRPVVLFAGWTDAIAPFYADADATLFTSKNEAYGRVLAESLAFGVPVIAGDAGVASEVLGATGGAIVSPPSAKALGKVVADWSHDTPETRALRRERAQQRSVELQKLPTQYEQLKPILRAAASSWKT